MRRSDLIKRLLAAPNDPGRRRLLTQFRHLADKKLADGLRTACYAAWTVEPIRVQRAAAAIRVLVEFNDAPEIKAAAFWINGISEITKGRFESAVVSLDQAVAALNAAGSKTDAAQAQVAKLIALAMLGRYDEAKEAGGRALKIFVKAGDQLAAGKIEINLSNIASRQSLHRDAERCGRSALKRFVMAGEKKWQAMAENGLAITYTDLKKFAQAEEFYRRALDTARSQKMLVTQAEIEASLGNLGMVRGRYADALLFLESSRQRYDDLGMPHQSAVADLEIGDFYFELDLLTEAVEIYARVSMAFRKLKMRREEARARLNYGRAASELGQTRIARAELGRAFQLFKAEQNVSGQAAAQLAQAELALCRREHDRALGLLRKAANAVMQNPLHHVRLALLEGRALIAAGEKSRAAEKLLRAAKTAKKHEQPEALQTALHLLGRLSIGSGSKIKARSYLNRSIAVIEEMRSPIASGEFGIAFFGSRVAPYDDLAKLLIGENKIGDAFAALERGRSRGLLDLLGRKTRTARVPSKLSDRATELRAELNFQYKTLERSPVDTADRLRNDIGRTESDLAALNRQIAGFTIHRNAAERAKSKLFSLTNIKNGLDDDRTLIEFVEFDSNISAFVIDGAGIRYIKKLGTVDAVRSSLEGLHFQFGALRYEGAALSRFTGQMKARADEYFIRLYDQLIRPIEIDVRRKQLIIVPTGSLHYVPFQALHDGSGYLVERFEITTAPSAAVWGELRARRGRKIHTSLLMGHADKQIPLAEDEVKALKRIVPNPSTFMGRRATFEAFTNEAQKHDLIHFACHGQFRPDNPMFSSLHLADGWITVHDLTLQRLKARLVTLSACETGLSRVFAGNEILGLARGFLAAGAASLVVSLWTVNDKAASQLMRSFYVSLQRGKSPAASLKVAQSELIADGAHPYMWAPFIVIGR